MNVVLLDKPKPVIDPPQKSAQGSDKYAHQFGDAADRKACQHEMCAPLDWAEPVKEIDLDEPQNKEPVRKYPFTLDPFQKVYSFLLIYY